MGSRFRAPGRVQTLPRWWLKIAAKRGQAHMLHGTLWSHKCTLPAEAGSAFRARGFVTQHLADHNLSYLGDDVRLVASELATNALLHAKTPFTVSLEQLARAVLLTVQDGSPSTPERVDAQVMDTHGRGLFLVDQASHDWGVTEGPGGFKSVWASFVIEPH
jgi:anti-sigma regulatory factor (Ser/Thr protein kinase)